MTWTEDRCTVTESFEMMNQFHHRFVPRGWDFPAGYAKESPVSRVAGHRAAFCFSGNEEYDIMINGKKIGGNAQRRPGDAVLQHGSIPLSIDREQRGLLF